MQPAFGEAKATKQIAHYHTPRLNTELCTYIRRHGILMHHDVQGVGAEERHGHIEISVIDVRRVPRILDLEILVAFLVFGDNDLAAGESAVADRAIDD